MSEPTPSSVQPQVFRLPRMTYGVVLFLLFCTLPLAFTRDGTEGSSGAWSLRSVLIVIPIMAAGYIARTSTIVDADGIRVRALFGQRALAWSQVRGLSVTDRTVYAVLADGALRLPCVRVADLARVSRASAGHLPDVAQPTPKFAPSSRRSRRRT